MWWSKTVLYLFQIPFIKEAVSLRKGKQLNIFGSAWIVPRWMLTYNGLTLLKDTHYQVLADYYKKFFDEYLKHGVKFWGVTTGNEPANAFTIYQPIQAVGWLPNKQVNPWIK